MSTSKHSEELQELSILEQPENFIPLKNIKERLSRIGHIRNVHEDESFVVDRLKRIYLPESYRKAKLRSQLTQKPLRT